MLDYMINPIKMGGLVKEVSDSQIKVHLHGRLGVITVPKKLVTTKEKIEPGHEMEFYFSYIKVVENPYDYDSSDDYSDDYYDDDDYDYYDEDDYDYDADDEYDDDEIDDGSGAVG